MMNRAAKSPRSDSSSSKGRLDRNAVEGSHRQFRHPERPLVVTVPGNEGKELAPGTLNDILKKGRLEMSERRYPVIIEQAGTGFSAYSPDVSGCAAAGDTREETVRNFQDALVAHFEAMREIGEPIPEPISSIDYVEVAA